MSERELEIELSMVREELATVKAKLAERQKFKDWVHNYLDVHGVPHHPPGTHGEHGCRIGDRMDWLMAKLTAAEAARDDWKGIAISLRDFGGPPLPKHQRQFGDVLTRYMELLRKEGA